MFNRFEILLQYGNFFNTVFLPVFINTDQSQLKFHFLTRALKFVTLYGLFYLVFCLPPLFYALSKKPKTARRPAASISAPAAALSDHSPTQLAESSDLFYQAPARSAHLPSAAPSPELNNILRQHSQAIIAIN